MIDFRNSVNRSLVTLALGLMVGMGVQAQTYLVKDLNQASENDIGGSVAPSEIMGVNGVSFFVKSNIIYDSHIALSTCP